MMRSLFWLAVLSWGCSPAPIPPSTPSSTPTLAAPQVSSEFSAIHQHFHNRMVPAFCKLYQGGSHFLRADAMASAESQRAARELTAAFDQCIAELQKVEDILAKLSPAPGPIGRYVLATQNQVQAWKLEARVYRSFAQQTLQAEPTKSPRMQKIVVDLEAAALARMAATKKGQKAFDLVFGRHDQGLTRPANIPAF